MIKEAIKEFSDYVSSKSNAKAVFGLTDFASSQYPVINIIPSTGTVERNNSDGVLLTIPMRVSIIVERKNEYRAYDILEQVLKNVQSYNAYMGHALDADVETEYTDNTFIIFIDYRLKFQIIKE
jgi:hypothetical protein